MPQVESKWNAWLLIVLAGFILTGSSNTLFAKWADKTEALGREFRHSFVQSDCMFVGEALVLFVYLFITKLHLLDKCKKFKRKEEDKKERPKLNPFIFVLPSTCDLISTVLMYTGLQMTNAASYQMLRGAVIVFTGILSILFLHRVISWEKWLGIFLVIAGLVIVGASDFIASLQDESADPNGVLAGDLLIIAAQLVVGTQMVVEELFVTKYNVDPPLAVGLEGLFGFVEITLVIIAAYFIKVPRPFSSDPEGRLENALDAFAQMAESGEILGSVIGLIISIAFYNVCGMTVTKYLSATTRKVSDSARTVLIWMVSLALGWQEFAYLQVIGFIILVSGMFVYNDIVFRPIIEKIKARLQRTKVWNLFSNQYDLSKST